MRTLYISIGNSDDKLTQREWSDYCEAVRDEVCQEASAVHGVWFAVPNSKYQNMCCCIEIEDGHLGHLRERLAGLARRFRQESIAVAHISETEFVAARSDTREEER